MLTEGSEGPTLLCYGCFSHPGSLKLRNEDRTAVFTAQASPAARELGFNLLGVFDGHGGDEASCFAQEHLASRLLDFRQARPTADPHALLADFVKAFDAQMLAHLGKEEAEDRSGTCALFLCTFGPRVFVVNVGDSRAVWRRPGQPVQQLTTDHKPDNQAEADRIISNQGHIYRNSGAAGRLFARQLMPLFLPRRFKQPLRVFPGHLSVSRALGDQHLKRYFPRVVVSDPDVFELDGPFDYLLLASDGVFDVLGNGQLDRIVLEALQQPQASPEGAVQAVLAQLFHELIARHCSDNVSLIFVAGSGFPSLASLPQDC